jgi:hypothetical protein
MCSWTILPQLLCQPIRVGRNTNGAAVVLALAVAGDAGAKQKRAARGGWGDVGRVAYKEMSLLRRHHALRFLGAGPNRSGRISWRLTLPLVRCSISKTRFFGHTGTKVHWLMAER